MPTDLKTLNSPKRPLLGSSSFIDTNDFGEKNINRSLHDAILVDKQQSYYDQSFVIGEGPLLP